MNTPIKISIIIVNYNVCDFILQSLHSIQRAVSDITNEIYVIDNNSADGSIQLIQKHFPDVKLIKNHKNIGFAAANNMAFKQVKGEFVVLLNPDTVIREDTFSKLIKFMDETSDAGAATCKILNPDGSFSIDCRHSIPTPMTVFWKMIGFNRLFSRNKRFGRYNLTFLDPKKTCLVDSISGSFMFIRKKVIDQVGFLDEIFFMYCEDIDYCYRILNAGWKIYYLPDTSIIHYKGQSTKKKRLDYIINFNKSLYLFYKKHFQKNYITIFRWLILAGISVRGIFVFIKNFINSYPALIFDILIVNIGIFLSFTSQSNLINELNLENIIIQSVSIHMLVTLCFLSILFFYDVYGRYRLSLIQIIKTNFIVFIILSVITFFIDSIVLPRKVISISVMISTFAMISWRVILRFYWFKDPNTFSKKLFQKRTVLVGTDEKTASLVKKMKNHIQAGYKLLGLISVNPLKIGEQIEGLKVLTNLDKLAEYIRIENITQIIFSTHNISYKTIIKTISRMNTDRIEFKIAPENLEVIIGKSVIYRLSDLPLVDIEYAFGKPFNRFCKRLFDVSLSTIVLLCTFPVWGYYAILKRKKSMSINIWGKNGKKIEIIQNNGTLLKGFINNLLLMMYVNNGQLSLVGAPIRFCSDQPPIYFYKPGITGLTQININGSDITNGNSSNGSNRSNDIQKYELFYLKNYNFLLDVNVLFKSVFLQKDTNN